MAKFPTYQLHGLNLQINPLDINQGEFIRAVNVESSPTLAKTKRPGYITYLGTTPNGSVVQDLAHWTRISGTQFWNYAFAGGLLYYSTQGTGAWTVCGNGTWNPSGTLTTAVGWDNGTVGTTDVIFASDAIGTVRHSTTGTSFTDTSGAPGAAVSLTNYGGRIYAMGTNSYMFYSNFATVTDWVNDSSNVLIPGAGRPNTSFTSADRLVITKNSGLVYRYDKFNLTEVPTNLAPTSPRSIGNLEDYRIYLNRQGFFGYGGNKPELLSNPIQKIIYNDRGSGVIGTTFDNAPGVAHQYKYYCSIGTVTDDLTEETVNNAVAVYDFQLNQWASYTYANRPTAFLSYKDASGNQQLIFGGGSQVFQVSGTATSDNGAAIETAMEGIIHLGNPDTDKKWNYLWAFFNPGCEASIQIAYADTFTKAGKQWINLGDARSGVVEYKFPTGSQSKLLFYKITDASKDARFTFYGISLDAQLEERT